MDRMEQVLRVLAANLRFRANDAHAMYMGSEGEQAKEWWVRCQTLDTIATELEAALGIRDTPTFEERAERSR